MITEPTVFAPAVSTPAEVDLRDLVTADSLVVALDFDGVLAPLQDDPQTSRMVPESAAAITVLAGLPHTRVALVSGRDIATLRRLSGAPDSAWLIGSHGAEADLGNGAGAADGSEPADSNEPADGAESGSGPGGSRSTELTPAEAEMLAAVDAHLHAFEHTLPDDSGTPDFLIERKPYSRTVHTRGFAPEVAAALHDHATQVVEEHPDIRVIEGHDITELAVKQATKGDGIRLLDRAGKPTALGYLGDDVTDEDAFAALDELVDSRVLAAGLTVKVGSARTRAEWRIADPSAVAELLERLAADRAEFLAAGHD